MDQQELEKAIQKANDTLSEMLEDFFQRKIVDPLKARGIPVVYGTLAGSGGTFIDVDAEFIQKGVWDFISPDDGTMAVITLKKYQKKGMEDRTAVFGVAIRQGMLNTWFRLHIDLEENELAREAKEYDDSFLDEDGEELIFASPSSEDQLTAALAVANYEGFGGLKNKRQRQVVADEVLERPEHEAIPSSYAAIIADKAEDIYELGILPRKVKELSGEGKSVAEIAKHLGVSKPKVERAKVATVPDYIAELLE